VSSYIHEQSNDLYVSIGKHYNWVRGFTSTLLDEGSSLMDFDLQFERLPRPMDEVASLSKAFTADNVDLVICAGVDSVIRWAKVNNTIPTFYFGAHPENNGLDIIEQENITGVRLNLPLVWRFQNFSILKELVPKLENIYIPLNLGSEFAFPNIRVNYQLFRELRNEVWIIGQSPYIGPRSVHFLADRIGCQYYEGPYLTLEELEECLDQINPECSALIGFYDMVLLDGAVNLILRFVRQKAIPLFWVNNLPIIEAGGVADFSSDFESVGKLLGAMSLRLLRDKIPVQEIRYQADPGEKFGINLRRCEELSIAVSPQLLDRFHIIID
jgi:ABC-type uncharacterized transport system substrate-binding protein